jgi:aminoglycoside phosphotransferase (APT) family kinase protein
MAPACPVPSRPRPSMSPPSTPSWRQIGDLHALLDPDALALTLRAADLPVEESVANYIRLKPGTGALVGLDLRLRDADGAVREFPAYIRTHGGDRTAQLLRKWHADRAIPTEFGAGVRALPGGQSALFLFPNDTAVRGMRFVADVDKLKRSVGALPAVSEGRFRVRGRKSELTTVRYKPERRLIQRAHLALKDDATGERRERSLFLRFFSDDRGSRLSVWARHLREGPLGRAVPEPVGAMLDGRMMVEEDVASTPLWDDVLAGTAPADEVAAVVAALHRSSLDGLPDLGTDELLRRVVEIGDTLRFVAPALESRVERVVAAMRRSAPRRPIEATVHGDLHLHQFLRASDRVVLVDFERLGRGHPYLDLGHLVAHTMLTRHRTPAAGPAVDSFQQRILEDLLAQTEGADARDLPFFIGVGLLERALLPFRHLAPDFEERCAAILDRAAEALDAGSSPAAGPSSFSDPDCGTFHPRPRGRWPGRRKGPAGERRYCTYDSDLDRIEEVDPRRDRKLPGLEAQLERGRLVAYRAGRRATVRVGERFAKVLRPGRTAGIAARHHALAAISAGSFPRVPAVVEHDEHAGVLLLDAIPGTPLHELLGEAVTLDDATVDALAASLLGFQAGSPSPRQVFECDPPRSLTEWAAIVRPHDRGLADKATDLAHELPELSESRPVLSHGDLHDRNLFVDGDQVAWIDLDLTAFGHPATDVGNLCAHFVLRALQRRGDAAAGHALADRLAHAVSQGDAGPNRQDIDHQGAATLIRLACVYRFRSGFDRLVPALLREAQRAIAHLRGGDSR